MLFNDGKKIVCLRNEFKFATLRKILLVIMPLFCKKVYSSNILTVVVAFALHFLGLATLL